MALAVGNISDKVHVFTFFTSKQAVNSVDDNLYDVDVLPLVESSDVVCLRHVSFMEYKVDGTGMVFNIEPVAHILALAIYRQRLTVTYVVDKQRYQFLGELIRAVVVRAVGHDGRHTVSVVEGTYKVVRACLACAVGAVRVILGCLKEELLAVCKMMLA